jgi:hypothetical protein
MGKKKQKQKKGKKKKKTKQNETHQNPLQKIYPAPFYNNYLHKNFY